MQNSMLYRKMFIMLYTKNGVTCENCEILQYFSNFIDIWGLLTVFMWIFSDAVPSGGLKFFVWFLSFFSVCIV